MQPSLRHLCDDWEALGCILAVALTTLHGPQRATTGRIRAMAAKPLSPWSHRSPPLQLGRRASFSTRAPPCLQRAFYSQTSTPKPSYTAGRARSHRGRASLPGQGEPSRANKHPTHPLFQDLQQQQQQQQPRSQSLLGTKPMIRSPKEKTRDIAAAANVSGLDMPMTKDSPHARDQAKATEEQGQMPSLFSEPGKNKKSKKSKDPKLVEHQVPSQEQQQHYESEPPKVLEQRAPAPPGRQLESQVSTASFSACRTPAQLRRAIHHFLTSHPQPSSQHLAEMLQVCVDLGQMASSSSPSSSSSSSPLLLHRMMDTRRRGKDRRDGPLDSASRFSKDDSNSLDMLSSALLDSIYHSLGFSAQEVFELATWIYQRGWEQERQITLTDMSNKTPSPPLSVVQPSTTATATTMRPAPSITVLNHYLRVCNVTDHVDRAVELFDDRERILKDVKPDVSLYAHWLWVLATSRAISLSSGPTTTTTTISETATTSAAEAAAAIDAKAQEVMEAGSKALAHQARYPYWIKMLLGLMIGGTVGKFTTLGLMALPGFHVDDLVQSGAATSMQQQQQQEQQLSTITSAGSEEAVEAAVTAASHVGSSLSADGVLHALASTDVATTAGLAAFALSFGLFLIRDTTMARPSLQSDGLTFGRRDEARVLVDEQAKAKGDGPWKSREEGEVVKSLKTSVRAGVSLDENDDDKCQVGNSLEEEEEEEALGQACTEQILERMQQVQRLPRARFVGPYFFQDLVSTDQGVLRRYFEEQYQQLKMSEKKKVETTKTK